LACEKKIAKRRSDINWRVLTKIEIGKKIISSKKLILVTKNILILHQKIASKKSLPPSQVKEIGISIISSKKMKKLNCYYRNKDYPTDVLSFSLLEGSGITSPSLGDVVIAFEIAKKQAVQFNTTLKQELLRLLIHGILHLLGYDHERVSVEKRREMQHIEKALLLELNSRYISL